MIDTKFGVLFTVELLHKYFANGLCNDFIITPSMRTQALLTGNTIITKQYDNKLYAGVAADAANKPLSPLAGNIQLTFFMQLSKPLFFNYTNLPFKWPAGKVYYFSNRNNNTAAGKNFITMALGYDSTKTYQPGDIAADAGGMVYQAIKSAAGITPSAANSSVWAQVDNNQYLSEDDALQWMPSVSTYSFTSPQTSAGIDVWGYDVVAKDYTANIISTTIGFVKPVMGFTLDLSMLPPGKYKLAVNAVDKWIYLNDELNGQGPFAVIDIFNDGGLPAAYKFLTGTGALNSPAFTIQFLNRYTIWKYVLASGAAATITDNAGVFQFGPASGTVFSQTPIPLSEKALSIKLTVNAQDYSPVACASPQRIITYAPAADTYSCSEIFLNY
ncbi:MAG TPA: hypothetical protein VHB48_03510 [Chitinophagaceae bacterium]|nr:hypothetical protein [Chitinophagaceae bacterium]